MKNKLQLKQSLYHACCESIDRRIQVLEENLKSLLNAKNNETKSSAGDKYETGRAMIQIEEENATVQLHQANRIQHQLANLVLENKSDKIEPGSLVISSQGNYFISIGIGKIILSNIPYYCISVNSPVGQELLGKVEGDIFELNGSQIKIMHVY